MEVSRLTRLRYGSREPSGGPASRWLEAHAARGGPPAIIRSMESLSRTYRPRNVIENARYLRRSSPYLWRSAYFGANRGWRRTLCGLQPALT